MLNKCAGKSLVPRPTGNLRKSGAGSVISEVSPFKRLRSDDINSIMENAQKPILEVFTQWKAPDNFKLALFVVRVGGHMLVDCDDPLAVDKACSTWPAFEFQARPVIAVEEAVRAELEAISWRDGLKTKGQRPSADLDWH